MPVALSIPLWIAVSAIPARASVSPTLASASADACRPSWLPIFGPAPGVDGVVHTTMQLDLGVVALAVFDDGSGPALYAGGTITSASGPPVGRIARWDGAPLSLVSGTTPGSGLSKYDQVYYRNAAANFCTGATTNFTSGYRLDW